MRPKATNTTGIYRHIFFYTPRPRAQRVAPTFTVFQRCPPNLRSNTPIFYRLFFVIANFNSIIFLITHKKNRAPRGVFGKIPAGIFAGLRPSKTPRDEGTRRHTPAPPSTPAAGRTHAAAAHPHTPHPHAAAPCVEERSRPPPPPLP